MVELHNTYWNDLVFLSARQGIPEYGVFDHLLDDSSDEVITLSSVPPFVTELGSVLIFPQTLHS